MEPGKNLGRGRGRGRRDEASSQEHVPGPPSPDGSVRSFGSTSTLASASSVGRGRGRINPSPVTLPENPEEDDFLAAFRRMHAQDSQKTGKGFPFNPPSEGTDSGFQSRWGVGASTPRFSRDTRSMVSQPRQREDPIEDIGSEDYTDLERASIIKRGSKGKSVPVVANYLRLNIAENKGIHEYHVDFDPPVENIRFKRKLINSLNEQLGHTKNFDGAKLYLPILLSRKVSHFTVRHPNNPEESISVKIKFVKKNDLTDCVHFFNVLLRRIMETLGMTEMNRHFYDHRTVFELPAHKLEIWPGYVTAVEEYEGGLMVCCDSSFRVLRTATVLDAWNNHQGCDDRNLETVRKRFLEYIIGKIVLTRYNNRHYRVDDIAWNSSPTSTFTNSRGDEITYLDYYRSAYNVVIRDRTQPLIIHRPKPNEKGRISLICLVPELCYITGMDSDITSNYTIMRDIAQYTKLSPARRNLALKEYAKNINQCEETVALLRAWGLSLEDAAVTLEGRELTIPNVVLNSNYEFGPSSANFGDQVNNNQIYDPIPVHNWLLLFSKYDYQRAQRMLEVYTQVTRTFGITVAFSDSQPINVGNGSITDYRNALERHLRPNTQFVVVIIPSSRDDLYAMIKKQCSVIRPVPSQVILSKTLADERRLRSVMQKIALQINCKLGGALWSIRIPLPEKIMFLGMDVYHDPKRRAPSVTAVVASLNRAHTKYYSRVIFQQRHQETVSSLLPILMDMMGAFAEENGDYPDRVIVWRDGVSDGQLEFTKSHEVSQIARTFKTLAINPKFTFCVVQKRINARFFLQSARDHIFNPNPGTVVDHTITRKYLYDFFLVSQLVRDGTVSPTHYIVLEDNSEVPPDLIQKFAFATSFMYYNWTGSIRVPAMCQYAHKLAGLVGQYIQAEPSMELSKNLYYL